MDAGLKVTTVEEYFAAAPAHALDLLNKMRTIVTQAAPNAEEVISYSMPAIKQGKVLVYYAANNNHIGLYPTASPIIAFKKELLPYKTSKGAIQFPLDKPLPQKLIRDIVKFRLAQTHEQIKQKETQKKKK